MANRPDDTLSLPMTTGPFCFNLGDAHSDAQSSWKSNQVLQSHPVPIGDCWQDDAATGQALRPG